MRRIIIKTILILTFSMIMFFSRDVSVMAGQVTTPLPAPAPGNVQAPDKAQGSQIISKPQPLDRPITIPVDKNLICGKNYEKNKIWEIEYFNSLDDAIDVWFSDQNKIYKKKINENGTLFENKATAIPLALDGGLR